MELHPPVPSRVNKDLRLNSDGYVELLSTVGEALGGEGGCGTAMRVAAGFGTMSRLREQSEAAIRKLPRLLQPEHVAS